MKLLLLFLLPLSLFGSKILSYNIYERTDRADIMFTFDTPYTGQIRQRIDKSKITIKLTEATIESPKIKKVSSKYLHSLTITPIDNATLIVASISPSTKLIASKTSDGYGLRLRFTNKIASATVTPSLVDATAQTKVNTLPTKKSEDISQSYYIVIFILFLGILILLYIKKRIKPLPNNKQKSNSWLFKDANTQKVDENITIRFQKAIDAQNSVVMLDYAQQSYLVLMGNNTILLDKFTDNKPASEQEFNEILQNRHEQLTEFLGKSKTQESQEPLQSYKERAGNIAYDT